MTQSAAACRTCSSIPCLIMTFMLGPMGLLAYWGVRSLKSGPATLESI